jgi:hypothetical protein
MRRYLVYLSGHFLQGELIPDHTSIEIVSIDSNDIVLVARGGHK